MPSTHKGLLAVHRSLGKTNNAIRVIKYGFLVDVITFHPANLLFGTGLGYTDNIVDMAGQPTIFDLGGINTPHSALLDQG